MQVCKFKAKSKYEIGDIIATPDGKAMRITDICALHYCKSGKGVKFETDRDNLVKLGGFSLEDASDYAYLYAEAVVWQTFRRIAEMSGIDEARFLRSINLGVSVDSSTKLAVT